MDSLNLLAQAAQSSMYASNVKEEPGADLTNRYRKLACTGCRQQKSRCDASDRYPQPCTRCAKKGTQCELKPDFKRTEKRAKLADMEREFAQLRRTVMGHPDLIVRLWTAPPHEAAKTPQPFVESRSQELPNPHLSPVPASGAPNGPVPHTSGATPHMSHRVEISHNGVSHTSPPPAQAGNDPEPQNAPLQETHINTDCEEKSLDSVVLLPSEIAALFLEYVRCYHPLLPVVDVVRGPERIYRACPALFWVIMLVALRRHGKKALLTSLLPLVKDILAEITISPIARYNPTEEDEPIMNACSVYSVQAFLLYTWWPPVTSSLSADSSWNTIGVALFQAIRIGLHTDHSGAMAAELLRTWHMCNVVSQNIALAFGFPAFSQFDAAQLSEHLFEVARFESQVAATLWATAAGGRERLALAKVLLRQLDELEVRLGASDGFRRFQLVLARVHLLQLYFLDAESLLQLELLKGLVALYNAAIALIAHTEACQARHALFVRYLPVVAVLKLWQTLCILVKLAHSPLKPVLDVENGKTAYAAAVLLVGKALVLKHDMAYRASGIMRNMWLLFRTLDLRGLTGLHIATKTRMAASLFFDCLSQLRDQVGMAKLNINTDVRENHLDEALTSDDEGLESPNEPSQKLTPGSTSSRKRKRALLGLADAESKARQIIRTIPLDPQPILATRRSNIFKVVNDVLPNTDSSRGSASPLVSTKFSFDVNQDLTQGVFDVKSDLLWRDVDSLMNDFGFHA